MERPIQSRLGKNAVIRWVSPLAEDEFAEYRDAAFLHLVGRPGLTEELGAFWPKSGPQWDGLGVSDEGEVLLVEAKAHIAEMCSPGTMAGVVSRARIEDALEVAASQLKARPGRAPWADHFYQLANRLAHLVFLRDRGVPAWLVLVNFIGDEEMKGPSTAEAWHAAYDVAFHVMGLRRSHPYARFVVHVTPDVRDQPRHPPE